MRVLIGIWYLIGVLGLIWIWIRAIESDERIRQTYIETSKRLQRLIRQEQTKKEK